MENILPNKYYKEPSVFLPENLLREARRQKNKRECDVPMICLLDPDGDLADHLLKRDLAKKNDCWACYHSSLYNFRSGILLMQAVSIRKSSIRWVRQFLHRTIMAHLMTQPILA